MREPGQRGLSTTACQLLIVAVACVILLPNLWGTRLWDMDEALYSSVAREMLQRENWVVPWFNGELFPEKPPLMFWTMMAGFKLFGINEFGARFFSTMMGVGTALATFHLGRLLFSRTVGLWAALVTCSTIVFTISARAATVDCALTFVTTLAMLFFVVARSDSGLLRWPYAVLMYACVGLAVLAKGPIGMLLPLAAMGLYMFVAKGWRNLFRSVWQMRPFTAIVVITAVALPWYIEVGRQTDWEWPRRFIFDFNLRPFTQPIQSHGATGSLAARLLLYFFHIPGVLFGFFPWSVFLGPAIVDTVRRIRAGKPNDTTTEATQGPNPPWRDGCLFACCWFGVWFVFWSICKTKLPHYLLPAYPALGLLVACWIDRWLSAVSVSPQSCSAGVSPVGKTADVAPWETRNAWISTILVGLGIAIAIPLVTADRLPGEWWIGFVGLILVVGGIWSWWASSHDQRRRALTVFAATAVVFLIAVFGFAALGVDRHQNAKPMIDAIYADWGNRSSPPPIATYGLFRESTVFYAGRPVTRCSDDPEKGISAQQKLKEFLAQHGRSYVITSNEDENDVNRVAPGVFHVVFRQRRFLEPATSKSSEMVVLRAGRK